MTETSLRPATSTKPVALYSCPFIPAEWVAAHGFLPRRVLVASRPLAVGPRAAGCCPYASAFAHEATTTENTVAIFTTVCDQMRRMPDVTTPAEDHPTFLLNVPTTWETPTAARLYRQEVERLGRYLEELGGTRPTHGQLAAVMSTYEECRLDLLSRRCRLPARGFAEALAGFLGEGPAFPLPDIIDHRQRSDGIPLALLGPSRLHEHFRLFDVVEAAGGRIDLDGTGTGERTLPAVFDRSRLHDNPLEVLTESYFGAIPDAFRRPNTALYQWVRRKIDERNIRGILFLSYPWCDTWRVEVQRMKEWAPVPLVHLTTTDTGGLDAHTETRIAALVEVLQ